MTQTRSAPPPPAAVAVNRARWLAVGSSASSDSRTAGVEAARAATSGDDARLAIVFASHAHDLEALLAGIVSVTGDTPMIGCSTAGEIATNGPSDAGVVVAALGGDGFSVATSLATGVADRLRAAGAEAGACVSAVEDRRHTVLLLLADGLAGDQQEVVRGAYDAVGAAIPLVGGCAGDDMRMRQTFQFHNGAVVTNAIAAAAIASDGPIGIGVRHGWQRVGDAMLVTQSDGTCVRTIDDRPALDAYLDRLQAPPEVRHDVAAFTRYAMTHPLGLSRRSGEEVRFIAGADFETRSLQCIAEVRQGGLVWIMAGDAGSTLGATDGACGEALAQLDGRPPVGLVAFDCIARRGVLGDGGIAIEVARIAQHAGGAPVAGFYTYGEIARTRGISGFHNQTLVVLALA